MAQKRSRKRPKTNSELRRSRVDAAESSASGEPRRTRAARRERSVESGPDVAMRPDSIRGLLGLAAGGWLVVAVVLVLGLLLKRWLTYGYLETLWLYIMLGTVAAAPAVGYIARSRRDVSWWVAQATVVAVGVLVLEKIVSPRCGAGVDCDTFGAAGWLEPVGVAFVIVVAAALAKLAGDRVQQFSAGRRPSSGRPSARSMAGAMLLVGVLIGIPIGAALTGIDMLVRKEPQRAFQAQTAVEELCFSDFETEPDLDVRPHPEPRAGFWSNYLVRSSTDKRPDVGGKRLDDRWNQRIEPHPYEAAVSYGDDGEMRSLECRKVTPSSGNADKTDVQQADVGKETPFPTRELLQAPESAAPDVLDGTPIPAAG